MVELGGLDDRGSRAKEETRLAVATEALTVTYGEETAVEGATFSAELGEFVVLMGPSGSGKSTLLLAMAGLQTVTRGRVEVAGRDLWTMSSKERTRFRLLEIGLVFQSADLVPELSLLDNVALPIEIAGSSRSRSVAMARASLEVLQIEDSTMNRSAGSVSGGQQQRAAIARALANRPPLVLADEPTGALDSATRNQVVSVLLEHARGGAAVIVATHDPEVASAADRVVNIRDGVLC